MTEGTTLRIPLLLAKALDNEVEKDPQYPNRSELARAILWDWVKAQIKIKVEDATAKVEGSPT